MNVDLDFLETIQRYNPLYKSSECISLEEYHQRYENFKNYLNFLHLKTTAFVAPASDKDLDPDYQYWPNRHLLRYKFQYARIRPSLNDSSSFGSSAAGGGGERKENITNSANSYSLSQFESGCCEVFETFDIHTEQRLIEIPKKKKSKIQEDQAMDSDESDDDNDDDDDDDDDDDAFDRHMGEAYEDKLEFHLLETYNIEPETAANCTPGLEFWDAPFKNNLTVNFECYQYIALHSDILIVKDEKLVKNFSIKPHITPHQARVNSSFSEHPHAVNFIRQGRFLNDKDVIVLCCDDGRVLAFDLYDPLNPLLIMELTMEQSAWGCDFQGQYLIISDNSHRVTLFYFEDDYVYFARSFKFQHNVPDLTIVKIVDDILYLALVSISGELITLCFTKKCQISVNYKPPLKPLLSNNNNTASTSTFLQFDITDDINNQQYTFVSQTINRVELGEWGWSVNVIKGSDFLEVYCPEYLGTTDMIDAKELYYKSKILNSGNLDVKANGHLLSSDFGLAAKYETVKINSKYDDDFQRENLNMLNTITDKITRIQKSYLSKNTKTPVLGDDPTYLFITTNSRVALFNVDSLICNAVSGDLFQFGLTEELEWHNRLSIVVPILSISTVLVVSQAGFLTVFRFVKYRGVVSLREEVTLPKFLEFDQLKRIVGCCAREVRDGIWWVYLTHSNGEVVKFELREDYSEVGGLSFTGFA